MLLLVALSSLIACETSEAPKASPDAGPLPEEETEVVAEIVINEVLAYAGVDETSGEQEPDWVEIHNTTAEPVDLSGYVLLAEDNTYQTPWPVPTGTILDGGGYLVVYCDEGVSTEEELHASFRIGRHDPTVTLASPDGKVVDSVTAGDFEVDRGYARVPDGGVLWVDTPSTSPGAANGRLIAPVVAGTLRANGAETDMNVLRAGCDCATNEDDILIVEVEFDALPSAAWSTLAVFTSNTEFSYGLFCFADAAGSDGVVNADDDFAPDFDSCQQTRYTAIGNIETYEMLPGGPRTVSVSARRCQDVCGDYTARVSALEVAEVWLAVGPEPL